MFLAGTPPAASAAPTTLGTAANPAVEAIALRKAFGPINAVDGIDLSLPAGRIYGMLGPNGSGKTTLIRLLTGLASATSGTVRVLGVDMPSRPNLARIGYMTQADGIYPELSVWENLSFFAALYGQRDRAAMVRTLELVELDGRLGTPAIQLSGGMRRRLSMACALVHHPAVIFLDEPTVGVDPALRVQFWDHFHRLAADGATLLVSSHVMDEADRCDELLFMRDGHVLAQGAPAELRARAGTDNLESAFLQFAAQSTAIPVAAGVAKEANR
jgi:ABC-2 type transport system ATP-binding protein